MEKSLESIRAKCTFTPADLFTDGTQPQNTNVRYMFTSAKRSIECKDVNKGQQEMWREAAVVLLQIAEAKACRTKTGEN